MKRTDRQKIADKKHRESEKGKISRQRYSQSEKCRITRKKADKKFRQSDKGKLAIKRGHAKRRHNMGFELLFDNIFTEDVDYHHINDTLVVAVPRRIHQANLGANHRQKMKPLVEELYNFSYIIEAI